MIPSNIPGNQAKNGNTRSAQYQKTFAAFNAILDLRTECSEAQYPASGLLLNVTTSDAFVWKDCTGRANQLTLPVGFHELPFGISTIEVAGGSFVGEAIAYWHG